MQIIMLLYKCIFGCLSKQFSTLPSHLLAISLLGSCSANQLLLFASCDGISPVYKSLDGYENGDGQSQSHVIAQVHTNACSWLAYCLCLHVYVSNIFVKAENKKIYCIFNGLECEHFSADTEGWMFSDSKEESENANLLFSSFTDSYTCIR